MKIENPADEMVRMFHFLRLRFAIWGILLCGLVYAEPPFSHLDETTPVSRSSTNLECIQAKVDAERRTLTREFFEAAQAAADQIARDYPNALHAGSSVSHDVYIVPETYEGLKHRPARVLVAIRRLPNANARYSTEDILGQLGYIRGPDEAVDRNSPNHLQIYTILPKSADFRALNALRVNYAGEQVEYLARGGESLAFRINGAPGTRSRVARIYHIGDSSEVTVRLRIRERMTKIVRANGIETPLDYSTEADRAAGLDVREELTGETLREAILRQGITPEIRRLLERVREVNRIAHSENAFEQPEGMSRGITFDRSSYFRDYGSKGLQNIWTALRIAYPDLPVAPPEGRSHILFDADIAGGRLGNIRRRYPGGPFVWFDF